MTTLTPRQSEILAFIRQHIAQQGVPPTLREIGAHFGIRSPNGVMSHITRLRAKGHLTMDKL